MLRELRTKQNREPPTGSAALLPPSELDNLMVEISISELESKEMSKAEKERAEQGRILEDKLAEDALKELSQRKSADTNNNLEQGKVALLSTTC